MWYLFKLKSLLMLFRNILTSFFCLMLIFNKFVTLFSRIYQGIWKGVHLLDLIRDSIIIWIRNLSKNGPSKICRMQPLKLWSDMVCLSKLRLAFTNFAWSILEYFVSVIMRKVYISPFFQDIPTCFFGN